MHRPRLHAPCNSRWAWFSSIPAWGQVRAIFADETSSQKSYGVGIDDGEIIWQDGAAEPTWIFRNEPEAGIWR